MDVNVDSKWKYTYYVDFVGTIWSNRKFSVGDTISFTTQNLQRFYTKIQTQNVELKAEIVRRDNSWKEIKKSIRGTLQKYK